jgi:CRISPR-associated protein Csm1
MDSLIQRIQKAFYLNVQRVFIIMIGVYSMNNGPIHSNKLAETSNFTETNKLTEDQIFQTTLKVAAAAFFHDIGKLVDPEIEEQINFKYIQNNRQLYQKYDAYQKRFTHIHALYSVAFFDSLNERHDGYLPNEIKDYQAGSLETKDDCFINLVGMHHKPETPMQKIIAIADWISSGMDRDHFKSNEDKIAFTEYKKTRLLPLFEQINIKRFNDDTHQNNTDTEKSKKTFDTKSEFDYRYSLKPVSPDTIFPVKQSKSTIDKNEYTVIYNEFIHDFFGIKHSSNFKLWFKHADSLCENYLSAVPAARAGKIVHDVSLYDHLKTTSAIATALFLYHKINNTLDDHHFGSHFKNEDIKQDWSETKFLLIGGDLYGIQDFIFSSGGETNKYRAKLLRGRSFSVSLMSRLAAEMICEAIGLPHTSIIISVAGKFTILAPNLEIVKNELLKVKEKINQWFHNNTYSGTTMGINYIPVSSRELVTNESDKNIDDKTFFAKWSDFQQKMGKNKAQKIDLSKYGGPVKVEVTSNTGIEEKTYLDTFDNRLDNRLCPLCRKRPAAKKACETKQFKRNKDDFENSSTQGCCLCRDQIFIGENLVQNQYMCIYKNNDIEFDQDKKLIIPIFDKYQIAFCNKIDTFEKDAESGAVHGFYRINQFCLKNEQMNENLSVKNYYVSKLYINGYVPKYTKEDQSNILYKSTNINDEIIEGNIKMLDHIACDAKNYIKIISDDNNTKIDFQGPECFYGMAALGVLKADVDNLGLIMGAGLKKNRYTLSRLSTLSRQLNNFFSLWLPDFLSKEYPQTYTLFAGGDDLFLIGPWNRMADLAIDINTKFSEYVCENPDIHLSAGISVHKPNDPIYKLAQASEEALEFSKSRLKDKNNEALKNSITFFGQTVHWSKMDILFKIKDEIEGWTKGQQRSLKNANDNEDDKKSNIILSNGTVYKLNYFLDMAEKEYSICSDRGVQLKFDIKDLEALKWRSRLVYTIVRNLPELKGEAGKDKRRKDAEVIIKKITDWLTTHRGNFKIPLWSYLYNIRQ